MSFGGLGVRLIYGVRAAGSLFRFKETLLGAIVVRCFLIEWVRRKKGIVHTVLSCVLKGRLMARPDSCPSAVPEHAFEGNRTASNKRKKSFESQIEPQSAHPSRH